MLSEVDMEDWERATHYEGGLHSQHPQVRWFWSMLYASPNEQRQQLLFFVTGSSRAPATGFAQLMGYSGERTPFTLRFREDQSDTHLPTASTCFNTLYLPAYSTSDIQAARLRTALRAGAGFDEGAVAH